MLHREGNNNFDEHNLDISCSCSNHSERRISKFEIFNMEMNEWVNFVSKTRILEVIGAKAERNFTGILVHNQTNDVRNSNDRTCSLNSRVGSNEIISNNNLNRKIKFDDSNRVQMYNSVSSCKDDGRNEMPTLSGLKTNPEAASTLQSTGKSSRISRKVKFLNNVQVHNFAADNENCLSYKMPTVTDSKIKNQHGGYTLQQTHNNSSRNLPDRAIKSGLISSNACINWIGTPDNDLQDNDGCINNNYDQSTDTRNVEPVISKEFQKAITKSPNVDRTAKQAVNNHCKDISRFGDCSSSRSKKISDDGDELNVYSLAVNESCEYSVYWRNEKLKLKSVKVIESSRFKDTEVNIIINKSSACTSRCSVENNFPF